MTAWPYEIVSSIDTSPGARTPVISGNAVPSGYSGGLRSSFRIRSVIDDADLLFAIGQLKVQMIWGVCGKKCKYTGNFSVVSTMVGCALVEVEFIEV